MEPCRVLFNVGFYRKEVFADELGSFLIFIRLGIAERNLLTPGRR
jgi:hypothetical protein